MRRLMAYAATAAAMAVASLSPAHAADDPAASFPSKPITLLVGFPAGGPSDASARILAERLEHKWPGAHVIVENRPGANGSIAAAAMVKAPADGYTLFLVTRSHVNLKALYSKLPFDIEKDFQPIAKILTMPNVMIVGPSVKAADYAEFVKYAKANPGKLTAFSSGNGSDPHLALAEFQEKTGLQIRHIPYKGGGQGLVDMMGGQVDMSFATLATAMQQIVAGKVRALAIGGEKRHPDLPKVPTFRELGVDFSPAAWYGVMAPAGTPTAIVNKLNAAINEVMNSPEGTKRLRDLGALPVHSSVADFTREYHQDIKNGTALIKKLNIHID
jgi:tripartite-type tricarboxylate transporter receptor subunit TctC